jgi:hypothetical protein
MGWLVAGAVLLPLAFGAWILGHFLRARTQAIRHVLSKGVLAQAEVVEISGRRIAYRYRVPGRVAPITASARVDAAHRITAGQTVAIRYLPQHPEISVPAAEEA